MREKLAPGGVQPGSLHRSELIQLSKAIFRQTFHPEFCQEFIPIEIFIFRNTKSKTDLIFVIFSPHRIFLDKTHFATKCVNCDKIDFTTNIA